MSEGTSSEKGHDLERERLRRGSTFRRESSSGTVDEGKQAFMSAMRPQLRDKFSVTRVEELLQETIQDFMKGKSYAADDAMEWTTLLSTRVNDKVRLCKFPRYKVMTLITIGENIGGGVLSGLKTQWDSNTDTYASYTYVTDSLFVIGTVFGVYYY